MQYARVGGRFTEDFGTIVANETALLPLIYTRAQGISAGKFTPAASKVLREKLRGYGSFYFLPLVRSPPAMFTPSNRLPPPAVRTRSTAYSSLI